jgi:hypothetical protein
MVGCPESCSTSNHGCPTKISKAGLFGIVCVTAANQHAPWLIFEAGALAKHLEAARVMPLCIDLEPAAVTGPLAAFQGRKLDKHGLRALAQDLSRRRERPLRPQEVDELFDDAWHRLETKLAEAMDAVEPSRMRRDSQEMLVELVESVRSLKRQVRCPGGINLSWHQLAGGRT